MTPRCWGEGATCEEPALLPGIYCERHSDVTQEEREAGIEAERAIQAARHGRSK